FALAHCLSPLRQTLYSNAGPFGAQVNVSEPMSQQLNACDAGPHELVLERRLSDHLPIIADFNSSIGDA
ncbi:hypothetical protein, partial [Hyphomonas oceanitis]|uniref:hypothetical protein n=1 Tax=Hyphomonas oceanitis TaxID=81033 RepID=UPI0030036E6B